MTRQPCATPGGMRRTIGFWWSPMRSVSVMRKAGECGRVSGRPTLSTPPATYHQSVCTLWMCHPFATPVYISEWLHWPNPAPKKSSCTRMISRKKPRSSECVMSSLMATPSIMSGLETLEIVNGRDHLLHFVIAQFGIHRQRQNLGCRALGLRKRLASQPAGVRGLKVGGNGIVHERADTAFVKEAGQAVASRGANDVEMKRVVGVGSRGGKGERRSAQFLGVCRGDAAATTIVVVEMPQLHAQNGGLQLVEAGVPSGDAAHVALFPSVLPQQARVRRDVIVVGDDHAAVTDRAEVLGR